MKVSSPAFCGPSACGCTGTDFNLWCAGAYVMSRKGMRRFLTRHAPQYLHTTKQEAKQFCEALDTRVTAVSILADVRVYDMPGVHYSHIPLFLPDDRAAAQSHIKIADFNSLVSEQQLQMTLQSIAHLQQSGILSGFSPGYAMTAALKATSEAHSKSQAFETVSYVLIPDFGIDPLHRLERHTGPLLSTAAVDVTTATARDLFIDHVSVSHPAAGLLWSTLLSSYFAKCASRHEQRGARVPATAVRVLVPLSLQLTAIDVPENADNETIFNIVSRFCNRLRAWATSRERYQCISVITACTKEAQF
jgi:hypothetical protein